MILIITYILNIIDYIFTKYWVLQFGLEAEANPLYRYFLSIGLAGPIKIIGGALALWAIHWAIAQKPKYKFAQYIPFALYILVDIYHIILLIMHLS